jgi:hypothetical protein
MMKVFEENKIHKPLVLIISKPLKTFRFLEKINNYLTFSKRMVIMVIYHNWVFDFLKTTIIKPKNHLIPNKVLFFDNHPTIM